MNNKKQKISLCINILLAITLCGLMLWMMWPQPKKIVENVSVVIITMETGEWGPVAVQKHKIDAQGYDSNIVVDILKKNNDVLQIASSELDSGFLTIVMGVRADYMLDGQYWSLEINGAYAMLGIREQSVKSGDTIILRVVSA